MFRQGALYSRRGLHEEYGGQQQGGISTPARHRFIMLFTGGAGRQYGYQDSWTDNGLFLYTGEGQRGDMSFVRGNRAIRDHLQNSKELHLFEHVSKGTVRYVGRMICTGFHEGRGRDVDGNDRRVIVFELAPGEQFKADEVLAKDVDEVQLWQASLETLRERAEAVATPASTPEARLGVAYSRSSAIRVYALRRADGICEGCGRRAPFVTCEGRPYLETHHLNRLSDGGPDEPQSVAALCPNCHRRAHYGEDAAEFNEQLTHSIHEKEVLLQGT